MDWEVEVRNALAAVGYSPEPKVIEELAAYALLHYEAARAQGCDEEEAKRRVLLLLSEWQRNAVLLKRPMPRAPVIDPPSDTTENRSRKTMRRVSGYGSIRSDSPSVRAGFSA